MRLRLETAAIAAAVVFVAAPARSANNAEEVVFSTPGSFMTLAGNSNGAGTPFGFWIWCAADAAPQSLGGYQNANACQGSMYFYGIAKHTMPVIGFSTETADGIYLMQVFQGTFAQLKSGTLDPSFSCSLENTTPDPMGPGNVVNVSCHFSPALGGGSGSATVTNAVVNVTGP
jgi:hypothetical protein